MLRLRSCVLTHLLSSHPAASPLHRLHSAAASPSSAFAVEQYLVDTCGLTRAQALKASTELSHLKSPTNPDAVLAYLAGLGLSSADIAALVDKDPEFLCAGVERNLAPTVVQLTGLGLSHSQIACLVSLAPAKIRRRSVVSRTHYYLSFFGSSQSFLQAIKRCPRLLSADLENPVKPNVAFLQGCGLGACDISNTCLARPSMLLTNPERLKAMVANAESLGVPRGSGMFRLLLRGGGLLSEENFAARMENLKNTFRWSDAELITAVSKNPMVLKRSKEALESSSKLLISEIGLEPAYIARRPAMLNYSLEGRIRPRYHVLKFLKGNGLLDRDRDYYSAFKVTEKVFVDKYICPHNEVAPHLVEDYAAACRGQVPTNFRFA
jgi:mTERF domain-containing protein